MKRIAYVCAGVVLVSSWAHAAETLDADAVRTLIAGNTAHAMRNDGSLLKNYFSPDGKLVRQEGDQISEGTWSVKDDGMHCVDGLPGGCARIVRNDDGTHDRVRPNGKVGVKWTAFVKGRDF